jgi:hypothetical protein
VDRFIAVIISRWSTWCHFLRIEQIIVFRILHTRLAFGKSLVIVCVLDVLETNWTRRLGHQPFICTFLVEVMPTRKQSEIFSRFVLIKTDNATSIFFLRELHLIQLGLRKLFNLVGVISCKWHIASSSTIPYSLHVKLEIISHKYDELTANLIQKVNST